MQPSVLISPLDWGLGHATRCVPIIKALVNVGLKPIVATSNAPELLLKKEFPNLEYLPLPGYNIRYSSGAAFTSTLLRQLPKAWALAKEEKNWVDEIVRKRKISAIISDNRPAFWSKAVPSIYITHQLTIKTGNRLLDKFAQDVHYHFINRFSQCWVPDGEADLNLAGELSHPQKKPRIPVKYTGPISRFEKLDLSIENDLLFLLSGPEPQRTIFEEQLLKIIRQIEEKKVVLVRGLPKADGNLLQGSKNLRVFDHVNASELNRLICASAKVVARGGYSTIMDLATLQKPALLIPTPHQKEQEYLCKYLAEKKYFNSCKQSALGLGNIVQGFENKPDFIGQNLQERVNELVSIIY